MIEVGVVMMFSEWKSMERQVVHHETHKGRQVEVVEAPTFRFTDGNPYHSILDPDRQISVEKLYYDVRVSGCHYSTGANLDHALGIVSDWKRSTAHLNPVE